MPKKNKCVSNNGDPFYKLIVTSRTADFETWQQKIQPASVQSSKQAGRAKKRNQQASQTS